MQKRWGNVRERKKDENLVLELKHFFIIFFFGELGFSEFKDPSASWLLDNYLCFIWEH